VGLNKDMGQSLTDIANWWAIIYKQISTVSQDLGDAGSDMSVQDWTDFVLDIQQAQKDWATFVTFATQMQTTVTTIQNQVVNVHAPASAPAAA
jgi:hypothetical protein